MKKTATRRGPKTKLQIFLLVVFGAAAFAAAADWWSTIPEDSYAKARYVGAQSCARCHQSQVDKWHGSDHDRAMALATDETVLGDFKDREFTYQGVTSRMFRRDGKFFIHTEGPQGKMEDFQIKYTFGVRPLQQYMVEFPDGRVQVLRVSWDTEGQRWFYVPPPDVLDEKIEPDDPLHWTGSGQNWNHMCADCHSTNFHKNFDLESNTFKSTYSEINVSCESCHGPGSLHEELAEARSLFWDRKQGYGLARLKGHSSKAQIETCAKCHARRSIVHPDFRPGSELLDSYEPDRIHAGLYHADGQILDEVYVYGSFLQSKMHRKNVRCTDCHDPHSLKLKFEGNRLCAQCHQPGKYDGPAHHHHNPGSRGASCIECHMPATKYMVVDPRRDHSLRVPRPDLSVLLGTPNACNGCHTDKNETAEWAAKKVRDWYGPKRPDDPHFAPALAAARAGKPEAEAALLKLLTHRETPEIVKATAIELLGQYNTEPSRSARVKAVEDSSPLVRAAAVRTLPQMPNGVLLELLGPRLTDTVRAVRIAAGRRLVQVPDVLLMRQQREDLNKALEEFRQAELANSDRAGAHLNLGNLYQELGDTRQAIESFRTAIRLEPYLAGPRSNLAALYEPPEDAPVGARNLANPAEARRLREEELELLARDARLLPDNPTTQYRYGLTLYLLGRVAKAELALARACELDPGSYEFRMLLTLLYEKQQKWSQAKESVAALLRLAPGDIGASQLQQRIEQASRQ